MKNLPILCLDESIESAADGNLEPLSRPSELAYVIYTSGFDGTPRVLR